MMCDQECERDVRIVLPFLHFFVNIIYLQLPPYLILYTSKEVFILPFLFFISWRDCKLALS